MCMCMLTIAIYFLFPSFDFFDIDNPGDGAACDIAMWSETQVETLYEQNKDNEVCFCSHKVCAKF